MNHNIWSRLYKWKPPCTARVQGGALLNQVKNMGNATQGTADRKQTATPAMDQVGPMQQSVGEQSPMNLSE